MNVECQNVMCEEIYDSALYRICPSCTRPTRVYEEFIHGLINLGCVNCFTVITAGIANSCGVCPNALAPINFLHLSSGYHVYCIGCGDLRDVRVNCIGCIARVARLLAMPVPLGHLRCFCGVINDPLVDYTCPACDRIV